MIVHQGYHLIQWQNLEKGKGLSVPSLLRLCNVFDVKLTDLLEGIGEQGSAPNASEADADRVLAKEAARLPAKQAARVTSKKKTNAV